MKWLELEVFNNPVACVIVLTALAVYTQLIKLYFILPLSSFWASQVVTSRASLKILITALPLLGLLGTINGLMDTFAALSSNLSADLETLMASGISDAMLTTQLGLSFVVPALVLQLMLNRRYRRYTMEP